MNATIAEALTEINTKPFKLHVYNIFRQFSYLKKNLGDDAAIMSVDFSRNYENMQRLEIQSDANRRIIFVMTFSPFFLVTVHLVTVDMKHLQYLQQSVMLKVLQLLLKI